MDKIIKKDIVNGVEYKYNWIGWGGSITDNNVIYISQADYDNLTPAEKADTTKNYVIIGQGGIPVPTEIDAEDVNFDNTWTSMQSDNVQDAIEEVFQSVSNGKELIADAITDKGVSTSASDSFQTMAENIDSLTVWGKYTEWSVGDIIYKNYDRSTWNVCNWFSTGFALDSSSPTLYYWCCLFNFNNDYFKWVVFLFDPSTSKFEVHSVSPSFTASTVNLKFYQSWYNVWVVNKISSAVENYIWYFNETRDFVIDSAWPGDTYTDRSWTSTSPILVGADWYTLVNTLWDRTILMTVSQDVIVGNSSYKHTYVAIS